MAGVVLLAAGAVLGVLAGSAMGGDLPTQLGSGVVSPRPCKSACPCTDSCGLCVDSMCFNSTCGLKCDEKQTDPFKLCAAGGSCMRCVNSVCGPGQQCGQPCQGPTNQCDPDSACPVCEKAHPNDDAGTCGKGVPCGGNCTVDSECGTACSICDQGTCSRCGQACDCGPCTCPMHRWCSAEPDHYLARPDVARLHQDRLRHMADAHRSGDARVAAWSPVFKMYGF